MVTHSSILTSPRSTWPSGSASLHEERSSTTPYKYGVRIFGTQLEPRYIFRAESQLTSELLRTL